MKIVTDPEVLHQKSRLLEPEELSGDGMKKLIAELVKISKSGAYGVGLSAIQIGEPVAITAITIKPTPNRPELEVFDQVCINLKVEEGFGEKEPMWEGCCSVPGEDGLPIYAEIPRYKAVRVSYLDEAGNAHDEKVEGFLAHVMQHEADHIVGRIITDLVDRSEFVSCDEFHKIMEEKRNENH
ncbi:peptide deformylase [Candidatus Saccharibacteria bacterium]|nr:peptide deformylase [Candidatus Saccharibacteria bacterium]MBR6961722.1 peptide deformylase [Candidatus Saccharibacteria bacterium]